MWKYGRALSIASPGRGSTASQARTWAALASRLRWLRVANLGRPVVPPVGCRRAGSPPRAAVSTAPAGGPRQQRRQGGRVRRVGQRLPALLAPRLQGIEPADRRRQHLVDADADDRRPGGVAVHLRPGGRDARLHQVEGHRQGRRGLGHQPGQLVLGVERVHRHGDAAGPHRAEQRDHERRAGRQVQAHALAAAQAQPGERPREAVDRVVELPERGAGAQEVERHPVRVAPGRLAREAVERARRDLDLGRRRAAS